MVMCTAYLDVALFSSQYRMAYQPLSEVRYLVVQEVSTGDTFQGHLISWYHPGEVGLVPVNQEPWGILKTERLLQEHGVSATWFPWEFELTHRHGEPCGR
jgi:hypothetical protein